MRFPGNRITECVFGNHHAGIITPENVKIPFGVLFSTLAKKSSLVLPDSVVRIIIVIELS